jgi:hypothetical protein
VREVDDDREGRPGLDGCGVAGDGEQGQGRDAQSERLPAHRRPVDATLHVRPRQQERRQEQEQPVTREPDPAAVRLDEHASERGAIESRPGRSHEHGRLILEREHARHERDEHEATRPPDQSRLPDLHGGTIGPAVEQQLRERSHQDHAGDEVAPARGETEPGEPEGSLVHGSTRNVKAPSVTWPSTESTRQTTR